MKITYGHIIFMAFCTLALNRLHYFVEILAKNTEEVNAVWDFKPDLDDLPMTHLEDIEKSSEPLQVLDDSGNLSIAGWMKRDTGLAFDKSKVPSNPDNSWLREYTKVKHLTQIVTFSEKKISTMRLFDFGLNCFLISTHILKAGNSFNEDDPFATVTDDLTIKELAGIVSSNTTSLRIEPFTVKSDQETVNVSERFEGKTRVLNLFEESLHPHKFKFDFDIFITEQDEPLTVV